MVAGDDGSGKRDMNERVVQRITSAIAAVEGEDVETLDVSLQEHVPTDAIRTLVNHESDSWRLQFETPRHVVEVAGNGTVLVDGETVVTPS